MLNCYFWIMRYRTSILCAQRASRTLVSGALKSHTEVERLLPLFWMLAYWGEISLFWASTTLNYILYAFYWCHRLLSQKEVNEKRLFKPKLYCFLSQISSFSSFSSNSSDGTHTVRLSKSCLVSPSQRNDKLRTLRNEMWLGSHPLFTHLNQTLQLLDKTGWRGMLQLRAWCGQSSLKYGLSSQACWDRPSFWPSIPAGRKQRCPMATRIEITERTKRVLRQLRNTSQKGQIGRGANRTPEWAKKLSWKSHLPLLNGKTSPSNLSVWFEQ